MNSTPGVPASAGGDTRTTILRVALELFAEQGFAATSTRELAERLGFTKAALYYYFRTKDDLLSALIEPVVQQLEALITGTPVGTTVAARRAVLAGYIDIAAAHEQLLRVLTQDPSVTRRPVPAAHAAHYERMMRLLAGDDTPDAAQRTRARAALGAIRAGLLRSDDADDPAVVQRATLAAACGALGIPTARRSN